MTSSESPQFPALERFLSRLEDEPDWAQATSALPSLCRASLSLERWGDLPRWQAALASLPSIHPVDFDPDRGQVRIGSPEDLDEAGREKVRTSLRALHPWRKGPFEIFGIDLDCEWRSDRKWDRLRPHLGDLSRARVLDVGTGNGYFLYRLRAQGAQLALGVDPSPLFQHQFELFQHFVQDPDSGLLPLRFEALPEPLKDFDLVLSMGVLYHRKSPIDHLVSLRRRIAPGGRLVLETLVVDGDAQTVLVPPGRYAKMRNVWFLPSPDALSVWLEKAGFLESRCLDVTATTSAEQRSTPWMTYESLADFLDPEDPTKTREGHPAPKRALWIAKKGPRKG